MDYITAIIGVVGTLLGTVLGFLLNVWANKGKLKFILLNDWRISPFSGIFFDMELINTSNTPLLLRDFSINSCNKKKKLYVSQTDTAYVTTGDKNNPFKSIVLEDFVKYEMSLVKCDSKSRTMVRFSIRKEDWTEEEINSLVKSNSVIINYTDNKGKKKKVKLKISRPAINTENAITNSEE